MADSANTDRDRNAILRGVYEDNLRTTKSYAPLKRALSRQTGQQASRRRYPGAVPVVLAIVLIAAGALSFVTVRNSEAVSKVAVASDSSAGPNPALIMPTLGPVSADVENISIAELYGLQLRTIVIDPGHGGRDPGALGQDGLYEKDVTLDVALRLKKRLEQHPGYRILLTRTTDEEMLLRDRIEFANEHDADLFLSIHVNWLPVDTIAPIETYYYGPGSDARAARLALRENANSGYSVSEFNDLTQRLGLELKIQESRGAAHSIQDGLFREIRAINKEATDWGAKSGDFMVLLGVEAPSVLAEIGSLSNREEEARLATASYREKLAFFLEQGLINYLTQHAQDNASIQYVSKENEEGL